MQLKPITTIAVLSLLFASLLVAGCTTSTTSTTNNTNQTTSTATTSTAVTHDAFLEKYLAAFKNSTFSNRNLTVNAWEVTWVNSTSARVEYTALNSSTNATKNRVETFILLPTTQDATNYLNAMNLTAYNLTSTVYPSGAYQNLTGHAPQVYKDYTWNEGNQSNISEYKSHDILQLDNIVAIRTEKVLS